MNYNELSKEIYTQNKAVGWWDKLDRCKLTLLQLVNTEIAEATEAERKNLMDDHLPHRLGGEVELADAMIRLLDMAGAYGWVYRNVPNESNFTTLNNTESIGAKHFFLTGIVSAIGACIYEDVERSEIDSCYSFLLDSIEYVAKSQGYDLEAALREKLAYNAQRQDHKRESRAATNGKKF